MRVMSGHGTRSRRVESDRAGRMELPPVSIDFKFSVSWSLLPEQCCINSCPKLPKVGRGLSRLLPAGGRGMTDATSARGWRRGLVLATPTPAVVLLIGVLGGLPPQP